MTTQLQDMEARRTQVAAMMLERRSQRHMARVLNVSKGTITGDVRAVRAEWLTRRLEDVEQWRAEELAILEAARLAIWQHVLDGKFVAIDRLLGIMDRRARLLGLDQPVRVDIAGEITSFCVQQAEAMGLDEEVAVRVATEILKAAKA